ncbi:MAG: methyl-accepting chemotaxis protein [Haloarculaceae archaeon]
MSSEDPIETDSDGPVMGVVRTVTPEFVRKRFALKFVIVLLIMGIAIMTLGAYGTARVTGETEDRIKNEYSGLAAQEANIVDQWIERNRMSVRLASGDDVWTRDPQTVSRAASSRLMSNFPSDTASIHVVDSSGTVIGGSSLAEGASLGEDRSWVTDAEFSGNDSVVVSSVYGTSGGFVVGFASPVSGASDRYLLIETGIRGVASRFQGAERVQGGYTAVVSGDGEVLIDERMTDPERSSSVGDLILTEYGDAEAREPVRDALALSENTSGVIGEMHAHEGIIEEPYTAGYSSVIVSNGPGTWAVVVHAPRSEVFGFAQTISTFGLLTTGAATLLIGLIGAVLGYNTSSSINRLRAKAGRMEEGDLDVEIESHRIDDIGRLYDGFAKMRDALREQIQEAEQARKEAEVSRAEALEMNSYLQEKAEEYSEIMQACSRGDLTRRMEPEGENDAMDQIAEDFNEMISELEMTTGQLKTFAVEVEEGGRNVQQSADTVRDASEQVADSVQKISDDAYDQRERLRDVSEEMGAVASRLEDIAEAHPDVDFGESLETVREVAERTDEAVELGEETMAESENVAGAAEEQAAELNEVSSRAEELVRYAQYLGDGLSNFETEEEHEFVFQTGAGTTGPAGDEISGAIEEGPGDAK